MGEFDFLWALRASFFLRNWELPEIPFATSRPFYYGVFAANCRRGRRGRNDRRIARPYRCRW